MDTTEKNVQELKKEVKELRKELANVSKSTNRLADPKNFRFDKEARDNRIQVTKEEKEAKLADIASQLERAQKTQENILKE